MASKGIRALIAALVMSATTANSWAGMITQTINFDIAELTYFQEWNWFGGTFLNLANSGGISSRTQDFNIVGFDTSLGTLTGVSAELDSSYSFTHEFWAQDNGANNTVWISNYGQRSNPFQRFVISIFSSPQVGNNILEYTENSRWCSTTSYCEREEYEAGDFDASYIFDTPLTEFEDNDVAFRLQRFGSTGSFRCSLRTDGTDFCGTRFVGDGDWEGSLTVTYTYDELLPDIVTIPEPTSLALLGLGLAGFGCSRKRKAS